ncbi:MAG: hypothetical protein WCL51_17335 [Bacteroidota bacterium]
MKKILILATILFSIANYTFAQKDDTTDKSSGMLYCKGNIGILTPFNSSNPSVSKSKNYSSSFSFGVIFNGDTNSKLYMGLEGEFLNSYLSNNDKTLGLNDNYNFTGALWKFLFQYNFCKSFNIQYRIGMGSIECSRPWFVLSSSLSANGKQIVEYPTKISNNCFVTGLGININFLQWLSVNANCDYIGGTFNFNNVVHSEDSYVTKVYNPDLKVRSYFLSVGLVIHTKYLK